MQSGREDDFDDTKAEKMPQEVKTPHNQRVNAVEIGLSSQHRNQGKVRIKVFHLLITSYEGKINLGPKSFELPFLISID